MIYDFAKYHSQVLKDIDHYIKRTKIGNVLKCEQKTSRIDNKTVNSFNMIISLDKNNMVQLNGMNDEYKIIVFINGNDVYMCSKCDSHNIDFRNSIKESEKCNDLINCLDNLGKIFKKKRE